MREVRSRAARSRGRYGGATTRRGELVVGRSAPREGVKECVEFCRSTKVN